MKLQNLGRPDYSFVSGMMNYESLEGNYYCFSVATFLQLIRTKNIYRLCLLKESERILSLKAEMLHHKVPMTFIFNHGTIEFQSFNKFVLWLDGRFRHGEVWLACPMAMALSTQHTYALHTNVGALKLERLSTESTIKPDSIKSKQCQKFVGYQWVLYII